LKRVTVNHSDLGEFEQNVIQNHILRGGNVKKVLFVCVENAGRSQMAEAFAKHYGEGRVVAASAGTMPSSEVNPAVAQAMQEIGRDISKNKPKLISTQMVRSIDPRLLQSK
jgi:protein-tyrosine-phosphatase